MKKLFILSFASMILLTGCGATETLSCSYESNANNGTAKINYDIDHEADEIKKVRITYNYDFDSENNNGGNTNTRIAGENTTGTADVNGTTNGNNGNNNMQNDAVIDDNIMTYNNDNTTGNNNGNTTGNGGTTGNNNGIDGVGTGTDGTTNDTQIDDDGIVDGVVGSVIDTIVGSVTSIILDSAGLRDRHATVQNTYGNVNGFSVQNTNDENNNYTVTYVIDYDTISDDDLNSFNLSRDLDDMRDNYVNQGFTCK